MSCLCQNDEGSEVKTSHLKDKTKLQESLLRAIDKGAGILGDEPVKRAFYYHVEKRLKIKKEQIPCNLDEFHRVLLDLFGQGTVILERRIARILFSELGVEFVAHNGWSLTDYIQHAGLSSVF